MAGGRSRRLSKWSAAGGQSNHDLQLRAPSSSICAQGILTGPDPWPGGRSPTAFTDGSRSCWEGRALQTSHPDIPRRRLHARVSRASLQTGMRQTASDKDTVAHVDQMNETRSGWEERASRSCRIGRRCREAATNAGRAGAESRVSPSEGTSGALMLARRPHHPPCVFAGVRGGIWSDLGGEVGIRDCCLLRTAVFSIGRRPVDITRQLGHALFAPNSGRCSMCFVRCRARCRYAREHGAAATVGWH